MVASYADFDQTCKQAPSIVQHAREVIATSDGKPPFTARQLQILMVAFLARSSSTYGTIPGLVSHLSLIGEHEIAAILNENARNEIGDRHHSSHASLLYDCFAVIGQEFSIEYPTPASYHILRLLQLGQLKRNNKADIPTIRREIQESDLHVPEFDDNDIRVAINYRKIVGPELVQLHTAIINSDSRLDEKGGANTCRNPYDTEWIATRCLELAIREASSVDEHRSGRLSFIGAWGLVVDAISPWIKPERRARLRAWVEAHNDETAGRAAGWAGAAEEGHAEDARDVAVRILQTLKPRTFANVLGEVASLNLKRLRYWKYVTKRMSENVSFMNETTIKDAHA